MLFLFVLLFHDLKGNGNFQWDYFQQIRLFRKYVQYLMQLNDIRAG